jgi:hypothetical protein
MEKSTALGPDHMPIEFFQSYWNFIKNDIMCVFEDFYMDRLDVGRLNYGTITLLPKSKEANCVQQYRPICLLNVVYKIITKDLMLRLEGSMDKIINKTQNAFVKNRNIMDGVVALHDILHDTKQKKKEGLVLKLDFEKAYDKINWEFLMDCLKQRGFPEK